jgi:hypothetical protein
MSTWCGMRVRSASCLRRNRFTRQTAWRLRQNSQSRIRSCASEDIRVNGLTDRAVRAIVKKEYFPKQLTVIPRDGDKVTADDVQLTWHAVDTKNYTVNLDHFAHALGKGDVQRPVLGCHHRQLFARDARRAPGHRIPGAWLNRRASLLAVGAQSIWLNLDPVCFTIGGFRFGKSGTAPAASTSVARRVSFQTERPRACE